MRQKCVIGKCCDGQPDVFWLEDITRLFCSLSPVPSGSLTSAQRLNSITRLTIYIFLVMLSNRYRYRVHFILLSLLFILLVYKSSLDKKTAENYAFLSLSNYNNNMNSTNFNTLSTNIRAKHSSPVLNTSPQLASYLNADTNRMSSFIGPDGQLLPDQVIHERLDYGASQIREPIYSNNMSNNYKGNSKRAIKADQFNFEGGNRESNAGIQYFSINQGVNRKVMVEPIIPPRSLDTEYWSKSSSNLDKINKRHYTDLTEDEIFRTLQPPGALGAETRYRSRVPGAVEPMNDVNDDPHNGFYGSGQFNYGGYNRRDFDANVMPIYDAEKHPDATIQPMYSPLNTDKFEFNKYHNHVNEENPYHKKNINKNNFDHLDKEDMLSAFNDRQYSNLTIPANKNPPSEGLFIPRDPSVANWYKNNRQIEPATTVREGFAFEPMDARQNVSQTFGALGKTTPVSAPYNKISQFPDSQVPPNSSPITDQLLNASPTYVYNDKFFEDPTRKLFLQDIQPKIYSWAVDQTPINSNLGITYAPQRPPRIHDQITSTDAAYPLYTRIDPQLVREDGTDGQKEMNPLRTDWSANYSSWNPAPGTINFENIYDPRFTSYGDPYRSYSDVDLGQVHYYYSDVDAYTMPNFITRSNVDFMEYRTPQNQVWAEYNRTSSVDDVKPHVENQFVADDLYHREDLSERLMSKMNRGNWQKRYAPLRRSANSSMPFGPS
jgi:hypothetical protein